MREVWNLYNEVLRAISSPARRFLNWYSVTLAVLSIVDAAALGMLALLIGKGHHRCETGILIGRVLSSDQDILILLTNSDGELSHHILNISTKVLDVVVTLLILEEGNLDNGEVGRLDLNLLGLGDLSL